MPAQHNLVIDKEGNKHYFFEMSDKFQSVSLFYKPDGTLRTSGVIRSIQGRVTIASTELIIQVLREMGIEID